jgi:hypothetical protein
MLPVRKVLQERVSHTQKAQPRHRIDPEAFWESLPKIAKPRLLSREFVIVGLARRSFKLTEAKIEQANHCSESCVKYLCSLLALALI